MRNSAPRTTVLIPIAAVACLWMATPAPAAPAPSTERGAKAKLDELKAKLPDLVVEWADREDMGHAWFSRARQISPDEAKITIVLKNAGTPRNVVTVFARFYNGIWVTTHFEASWPTTDQQRNRAAHILLVLIDELAEK